MTYKWTHLSILITVGILSDTSLAYFVRSSDAETPLEQVSLDCVKSANHDSHLCVQSSSNCTLFHKNCSNCKTPQFQNEMVIMNPRKEKYLSEYMLKDEESSFRRCSLFNEKTTVDFEKGRSGKLVVTSLHWKGCYTVKNPNPYFNWKINTFKDIISRKVFSVETKSCIIVYPSSNCLSSGVLIDPLQGNLKAADFTNFIQTIPNGMQSFRACQEWERTGEIRFYQGGVATAYIASPRDECTLVLVNRNVEMLKSSGTECLMLYSKGSCSTLGKIGDTFRIKLGPNKMTYLPPNFELKSFRRCTPAENGFQAKIKFYGDKMDNFVSFLVENISKCKELPGSFPITSMEIQETCISFYSDRDCHRYGFSVRGGENYISNFVAHMKGMKRYRSFKLCQPDFVETDPTFELKMTAAQFKVNINLSNESVQENVQRVILGEDQYFVDTGSRKFPPYDAWGKINESTSVEYIKHVEPLVDEPLVEFINVGRMHIPSRLITRIRHSISSIYALGKTCNAVDVLTLTEVVDFLFSSTPKIPPYNDDKYKVERFVDVASVQIEYDAFVNVSGIWSNGIMMKSTEFFKYIPGEFKILWMEERNMMIRRTGKILVKYGFKSGFNLIENKSKAQNKKENDAFQIQVYFQKVLSRLMSMITAKN